MSSFFNQCPICWKSREDCRCAKIKEAEENHKLMLNRHRNDSEIRIEEIQYEINLAIKKNETAQIKSSNKIFMTIFVPLFISVFIFVCWSFYLMTIEANAKVKLINTVSMESPDIARKIVSIFKQ